MRYFFLSILMFLSSCSTVLDFIKPSSGLSVETEITAGDKKQTVRTEIGEKTNTTNTADSITQSYSKVYNGPTIFDRFIQITMAFMIGWLAMPSARQMVLMVKKIFVK